MRTDVPDLTSTLGIPKEPASTMVRSYSCEFSVIRGVGSPVTTSLTPYPNPSGLTIDMSVGLIFPLRAERARKNPKVGLSYCVPATYRDDLPALVVVRGHAAVRDADLQANTDRYLNELMKNFPGMFAGAPKAILRRLAFYLARIWVEVTPLRVWWWPKGDLSSPPQRWDAPDPIELPESDPPPIESSRPGPSRFKSPSDWRPGFESALERLGPPALSTVDDDGWPVIIPTVSARAHPQGAFLELPSGLRPDPPQPGCLTFHTFEIVKGSPFQDHSSFTGQVKPHADGFLFTPDRQLISASLPNRAALAKVFYNVWRMRHRLPNEAARRQQPTPTVRI